MERLGRNGKGELNYLGQNIDLLESPSSFKVRGSIWDTTDDVFFSCSYKAKVTSIGFGNRIEVISIGFGNRIEVISLHS